MTAYPQYSAQALPRWPFGQLQAVAIAADNDGDVVQTADGRVGIVQGVGGGNDAVSVGDPVVFKTVGVYEIASASATVLAAGVKAYWDPVACQIVAAAGGANGAYYAGIVAKAKAAGATTVFVDINVAATLTATLDTAAIIAAAGTTQAGATAIATKVAFVTGANNAAGVALPPPVLGLTITVVNEVANKTLAVYPHGTEQIDAGGASTAYTAAAATTTTFRSDGTNWFSQSAT
jgi:hypothetical protein